MNNSTPSAPSTPADVPGAAGPDTIRARLDRLETYLASDPGNDTLRVDAFQTALRCADWARATAHLVQGRSLQPASLQWALREADLCIAQRQFSEAEEILGRFAALPSPPPGFADVVLHNLAYIDFTQGRYAACVARIASRMEALASPGAVVQADADLSSLPPALPMFWLRALHRVGERERAVQWSKAMADAGQLSPQLAGIASLAALDHGELSLAAQWAALADQAPPGAQKCLEAYVAQASLSLAAQDSTGAEASASAALQLNPRDGRAWSVLAFAALLSGQAQAARSHFAKSLEAMPEHVGTWHGQAWTALVQKDLDGAQQSFETALALDRNFAESHGGLAVVLALKKQNTEAQKHIALAHRLDPSNLSGRYAEAVISGEASDTAAFQKLVHRLLGSRAGLSGGTMEDDVARGAARLRRGEPPEV